MSDKLSYRGKRADLNAEREIAVKWFKAQILSVLSDEMRQEITDHGWPEIDHITERMSGGYNSYYTDSDESKQYFHVWRMPHPRKQYGNMRFVIRKNGTLNTDNLKDAVEGELWRRKRRRKDADIHAQNLEEWGRKFNFLPPETSQEGHLKATISLSETKLGECVITLPSYSWGFGIKKTIRIDQVRDFIAWAEGVKAEAKKW